MSKPLKVSDQVYLELNTIRDKGETFSQIIERLLQARVKMFETISMVEGVLRYQEWKQKQLLKSIIQEQEASIKSREVDL